MKVKVYFKGRNDKVVNIKINEKSDLKNVVLLAKSELYRKDMLKDLDYSDNQLIFKIDGEKVSAQKLVSMGLEALNRSDDKPNKKKKKKDKDKTDKKNKSKKKDKQKEKKDKKKDKKKSNKKKKKKNKVTVEDGYVCISRRIQ